MWNYSDKVMEHFLNPRNAGEIKNADAVAEVGNISCGDALKLYLKLDTEGRIADAKFQTFGCASAIASSSALTELIKGKTLDEAEKITNDDIVAYLGELPEAKIHCSVMGMEALQAAIANYHGHTPSQFAHENNDHEGAIICHCFGVTDTKIKQVAKANNIHRAEEVKNYIKAGGGCGCCLDNIQELLDTLWAEENAARSPASAAMTPVQKMLKIQTVIEKDIKPLLERDGGSIEFLNLVDNTVQVRLSGACGHCPASKLTLRNTVQAKLREAVSPELEVEEIRN